MNASEIHWKRIQNFRGEWILNKFIWFAFPTHEVAVPPPTNSVNIYMVQQVLVGGGGGGGGVCECTCVHKNALYSCHYYALCAVCTVYSLSAVFVSSGKIFAQKQAGANESHFTSFICSQQLSYFSMPTDHFIVDLLFYIIISILLLLVQ